MLDIGLRIKELRNDKKLTQNEFCDIIGIKQANLSHIENSGKKISVEILHKIISNFNISGTWLLSGIRDKFIEKEEKMQGKCANCEVLKLENLNLKHEIIALKDELLEVYRPKNAKKAS